jgi:NADP-dependent 3-hydroxy acid dehydrogenase YdfG
MNGKVVAITGASSGIGAASALLLAARGAKVVLEARRTEHLEGLVTRITQAGGEAAYVETDLKRREDLVAFVEMACARFGRLDVLVSNAGIGPISRLDELRVADWEEMIDVNLKGFLYAIAAALPVFRKQGFGHFITIVSTAGLTITPTMAVYAGTKNAVRCQKCWQGAKGPVKRRAFRAAEIQFSAGEVAMFKLRIADDALGGQVNAAPLAAGNRYFRDCEHSRAAVPRELDHPSDRSRRTARSGAHTTPSPLPGTKRRRAV